MNLIQARIGLVLPKLGANVDFWETRAPAGVEFEAADLGYRRGDNSTFAAGLDRAEELAAELAERGCDPIVVSGTPPFLIKGAAFEQQWRNTLSRRIERRVITGMSAHAFALQALGARKVAVATYYGEELNQAIVRYLAQFDIEAVLLGGFSLTGEGDGLYSTPMQAQHGITPEHVYQYCCEGFRRVGRGDLDGLYINGGGWDPSSVISSLERDLHTSVVWAPVAEIWLTYSTLGINNPQPGLGRLLESGIASGPSV